MGMLGLFREWLEHRSGQFRPRTRTAFVYAEGLESRRMLSAVLVGTTLTVTGTAGPDTIAVTQDSAGVTVVEDGVTSNFGPGITINTINVFGGASDNHFTINSIFNSTTLNVTGGAGNNTLTSQTQANTWMITGGGSGTLNGKSFSNIQNLVGGGFNDDFQFGLMGFVQGTVDGGGGINILDYSTRNVGAVVVLVSPALITGSNGTATAVGGGFADITDFHGSTDNTDMLTAMNTSNVWTIAAGNSGDINGQFFFTGTENITGGSKDDRFVLTPLGFIQGTITGGGGSNTLDYSTRTTSVVTNLQSNTSTAIGASFNQIGTIIGAGTGSDVLTGINQSNVWNITGANSGTVNSVFTSINFQGYEDLIGGTMSDSFKFTNAGVITGTVSGGGGFDTLDYSLRTTGIVVNLQSISSTAIGGGYISIENVIGSSTSSDLIQGANAPTDWNISGANSGSVNWSTGTNSNMVSNTLFFSSIENLSGGTKNDSFNFLAGGSVSGVIDGGLGVNSLDYAGFGVLTSSQPLTAGGKAATTSTSLDSLDQTTFSPAFPLGYAAGDTIKIVGTRVDGSAVNAVYTATGVASTDTVGALLTAINQAYLSGMTTGATATLNSAGQIVLTANHPGPSSASLTLTSNPANPSGTSTQFSNFISSVSSPGTVANQQPSEVLTLGQSLTVGGKPATATSSLDNLDQTTIPASSSFGYTVGDLISIQGTRADGTAVSTNYVATGVPATDTVGALLAAINRGYNSGSSTGATASINSAGQIELTVNHTGPSSIALTLGNNPVSPSGTTTGFSSFVKTVSAVGVIVNLQTTGILTSGPLTVATKPALVSTSLNKLDQTTLSPKSPLGYAAGDSIRIAVTRLDGSAVYSNFNLTGTPSLDTVGALLNAINQAYSSATTTGANASLNASGQIVVTSIHPVASITLTSNPSNPSGTMTKFPAFVATATNPIATGVGGGFQHISNLIGTTQPAPGFTQNPNTLIAQDTANAWNITGPDSGTVDNYSFSSFQNLTGGLGVDVFHVASGGSAAGIVNGGPVATGAVAGKDWLDYSGLLTPVSADLSTGLATDFGYVMNVQNVHGGDGTDTLNGNAIGNILVGGQSSDTITGGSGLSLLIGDLGADTLVGGTSSDIVIGGRTDYDNNLGALASILAEWQAEWAGTIPAPVAATVKTGPIGTSNTVTSVNNQPYTFAAADFGFTDPHDSPAKSFTGVVMTTLPSTGSLKDNNVAVTAGQFIKLADITAGKLTFSPLSGTAYTSFKFQVEDSGSIANIDPNPKTMTVFVNTNLLLNNLRNGGGLNGNNTLVADVTVHTDDAANLIYGRPIGSSATNASPNWLWGGPAEFKNKTPQDITNTPINNAPILTGTSQVTFTVGNPAVIINSAITIATQTSSTLASATIHLTANFNPAQDSLGFVPSSLTGNIVGSYNATTGTLTLTSAGSTATVAQFQTALRRVTYYNGSSTPTTAPRTVSYQVFDGFNTSNSVNSAVNINFAPILTGSNTITYTSLQPPTAVDPIITVTDRNTSTLAFATVQITSFYQSNQDFLNFVGNASTGSLVGNFDFNTGTLTLTAAGTPATLAQYQAALRLVTYQNFGTTLLPTTRTVSYQVSDGVSLSNVLNSTINFV